ncbi:OmpH family outer membrane protein [Niabella sp. CC-SYL272]|uniref:OmpH family outer membrane protein n=1 Tax=Niabella agricola TaxID=2891571 RepID=UPI001F246CAE|nr:OmpH family outer membrane protein [Niabella agricola]MCF3110079.1 OmpH family outer membrane protein [Niabella agricola]
MKRIKFLALALGMVVIGATTASAQKIGYVDIQGLVGALPEAQATQQKLEKWAQDSVGGEYSRLSDEIKEKDSLIKDPKTSPSIKKMAEEKLGQLQMQAANWQQYAQQMIQGKQAELFQPLFKKVTDAVRAYAKEKGYTYVLHDEVIFEAPQADNLSLPVAQKLGINVNQQQAPATGGAAPAAGGTKPAPKK